MNTTCDLDYAWPIDATVCDGGEETARIDSEADAVAWALDRVGATLRQVTLERTCGVPGEDFDVRHFTWHDGGGVRDSGWRSWRGGRFVGGNVREAVR